MYKSQTSTHKKRKARQRHKKSKRSKVPAPPLFQEPKFDSSEDSDGLNDLTPSAKSRSFSYQFEKVVALTPSKSEDDISIISDAEDAEVIVSNNGSDVSCLMSESRYEETSDEEVSYSYSSISEEFKCENGGTVGEVVSAQINGVIEKTIKPKKPESPRGKKVENSSSGGVLGKEARCYYENDEVTLVLKHNQTVYFHGLCNLTVFHGKVEILGHILTKNSPAVEVYSPRGSSLLSIKNITDSDVPVTDYFPATPKTKFPQKCAVVFCKKLHDPRIDFIEKHISQQILPRSDQNFPRIVFQPKEGSWNLLKVDGNWNRIIDNVGNQTKLMICGGKGVGKTTFLRYAINRLLVKFKEVRVIDLDPGQSEFTVPGCISIIRVNEPVFGVNYTHLRPAERSLISNINIAYDPQKYIFSVKQLINAPLDDIPTLVNYMGYAHGLGIHILSAVIAHIQPTDVLQITSKDPKKNYKFSLKPSVVEENAKLLVEVSRKIKFNFHHISSKCDHNDGWTAQSRQLREMCILSYISQMVDSNSFFQPKAAMIYRIKFVDIIICDLNGEKLHPAAVNASMLTFAVLENEEKRIFRCLGWGVVRGVDFADGFLVVQTPETAEILDKTTHLVSHGGVLPPSLFMTPEEIEGGVPYVMDGVLTLFGQIPKRSRQPVKSKE